MINNLTYTCFFLLFISRDAVPVRSNDKDAWGNVTFLKLRWSGMSDDWINPEMDELEIGQVLLCTTHRLY